ncbi:MscS Mechanosensitive ion channel [Haloterrigena turkmenica DSM 5511]|uniref:MscS Mechanosensitive ion channel n=1 Tax=Haloterrigena turkmenica (strain ATCC 51198 / DSM 5511 / JCM 9101 / NCIMB 13204 / VKM B-1734 / 4k) TaxID=543526 RepID=D2RSG6_HALTV|nr:mechanosensitive ion channel family protein [Haloterrigena turkmenica]ADB60742.1 MscS Mechanosensitive ion channel [Haloterrigena turkmenica DSM 5511]
MRGVLQGNESEASEAAEGIRGMLPFSVSQTTVNIVLSLLVVVAGWYLSKYVVRIAGRTVARRIERPSVTRTVLRAVRLSVLLFSLFIAAAILGVGDTQILLSVTVISAVVAVVLAPLVGSLINGFFVLADRPYEIGDMIEIPDQGHRGFVEDITIRYTKIFTLQNTFIVIPNSAIQERDVINYSAEDERTRISLSFEVTYGSDIEAARRQAERAARAVGTVISGGPDIRIGSARYGAAPLCNIEEFADHGVVLELFFWVKNPYKLNVARSAVQTELRERFADIDAEFAYPRRHHVFDETSGVARMSIEERGVERPAPESSVERGPQSEGEGKGGDGADVGEPADQ